ncbi:MAG TPA: DnaD domain protein [Candidatus Onthousia faecipullorum]|uniref:DnaD domain protein n=1 Tax=Candidatus Onthousia faecipullorum TaxID=2840887 RepID=A0A9D1GCD4_9FIRM|nr:DnaD domain protein [Candidatus Onthousia faecipullorum]
MKQKQLVSLLESKNIVVPLLFFKEYKKLNISLEEFIFLMYLKDKGNTFTFDPKSMSEELGISIKDILVLISSLTDKKLLLIDTFKNDKGIGEEKVDISLFYEKIASIISDEVIKDNEEMLDTSIFSTIEKEFGRTLNSSEIEFIKAWASSFDSGVIIEAVKEAVLNGVSSIRYIDKILYEWDKKGIKTSEDVRHFLNNKNKEIKEKEPVEVFDYDWFDDDDDE